MAQGLKERLADVPSLRLPAEPDWGRHIYQSFVVSVDGNLDRDQMIGDLRTRGIETTLGTYALHDQPLYQRAFGYRTGQLPNSHAAFERTITLPLYPQMDPDDLDTVATRFREVIAPQLPPVYGARTES